MRFNSHLLKKCREERGWTQDYVAHQELQIDVRTLRAYESGEVNRGGFRLIRRVEDLLQAMARLFELSGGAQAFLLPDAGCRVDFTSLSFAHESLYGRAEDLAAIGQARERGARVVAVVGWGGIGKSALLATWLAQLAAAGYPDLDAVFGWRFHMGGGEAGPMASADPFFEQALRFFGDPDPHAGTCEARGVRLAALAQRQRALLVIDAMEPLQEPGSERLGRVNDPALRALLVQLASGQRGCFTVVTSRIWPSDLSAFVGGAVVHHPLAGIAPRSGRELLLGLGVTGSEASLQAASEEARGHPLTLNLLGRYLKTLGRSDIGDRSRLPRLSEGAGGVLEGYRRWFDAEASTERAVLWLVSLFDRPAPGAAIDALLSDQELMGALGLSPFSFCEAVSGLERHGLLTTRRIDRAQQLDAHPLVREYFEEHFRTARAGSWRRAHGLLFDHFAGSAPEQPETIEEMEPLFIALRHGYLSDRVAETFELFRGRIGRYREFYAARQLGAFGLLREGLAHAFKRPWSQLQPHIPAAYHADVFSGAGFVLKAMGQLEEARTPTRQALSLHREAGRWARAVNEGLSLAEMDLLTGALRQAQRTIEGALQLALRAAQDRAGQKMLIGALATQAVLCHHLGDRVEARYLFEQAEAARQSSLAAPAPGAPGLPRPQQAAPWSWDGGEREAPLAEREKGDRLRSIWGHWYCELLLDLGEAEEALVRAAAMTAWRRENRVSLLSLGLSLLTEGRACVRLGRLDDAAARLEGGEGALGYLLRANQRHHLVDGLLAVAELRTRIGIERGGERRESFARSAQHLQQAEEIARGAGLRPLLVEALLARCALLSARLRLLRDQEARPPLAAARDEAEALIDATGYERRRPELRALQPDAR